MNTSLYPEFYSPVPSLPPSYFFQELAQLRKDKLEWCDIQPADDDIMRWTAMLVGPVSKTKLKRNNKYNKRSGA